MGLCCSELGKALQKCSLQGFVPGRIPVRTFEGQKFLTGISACLCCFCCSMHTSLGKCGMATTGKLLDHCTQLSNCKNPLAHHTQCQYTRGGHVPVIQSITNTPVVAMSHIHCPTDNTPVVAMPPTVSKQLTLNSPIKSTSFDHMSFYHTIVRFGLKAATSKQPPHVVRDNDSVNEMPKVHTLPNARLRQFKGLLNCCQASPQVSRAYPHSPHVCAPRV